MKRPIPLLRLSPEAAGQLQQQHDKASTELAALLRHNKEFDRQLNELIGPDALRRLHKATENALLLVDLKKEAA
ncbi:hypothetical protein [Pseudomonas vanderleydeniana]|uniref:Uncharacterized protein n=1 Tax=Pseudomonas vanderleydeniana TaxID=2745495 RepID=A0A9E6PPA5_9PSED|nr:hypothetical protein [Pseudomonas vanderleydeniana]QXI30489.1 hypothetical protein HU752_011320 [Pseudomonas vanderleydeniana]